VDHGFSWIGAIPGLGPAIEPSVTATAVALLLIFLAWIARAELARAENPLVPAGRFTPRDLFEMITIFVESIAEGALGHHGRQYVPFLATFFVFILVSNLLGLIPGFNPPTGSFGTTLGLGLVSFFAYNYFGFREHGVTYLRQFLGPILWLAPLMVIVETLSHVFRPLSLAIRLFGNMFADHLVLGIFTDLTKLLVPVAFYVLGAFVCVVQAFVFTVLTTVYISLAVSHDH